MDVRDAVSSRFSCRAFLPIPVPYEKVRGILERAARAPSGGNLQPWLVHALAGAPLAELEARVRARVPEHPRGEGAGYDIYPRDLAEPYRSRRFETGELLYRSIGVPREDRAARLRQYARNWEFFGAPVGLFVSVDRRMGPPQWADLGMFIQTIMLLAREDGLDTCGLEAWTHWDRTASQFLGIPPEHILFCGIALGYADRDAPINGWRTPRVPVDSFTVFRGFTDAPQS
jgi:nitroreductase